MNNRIIKFRGMDANGVMQYGRLSQDQPGETVYYKEYSQRICWDNSNIPVSNKTLGQFTGLLDKNGKDIYEGDILIERMETPNNNQFKPKPFVFPPYEEFSGGGMDYGVWGIGYVFDNDYNNPPLDKCEVIGNIYEHGHLLKQ